MRKREVLQILNKVLFDASMERANFSRIVDGSPFPTTEDEVTGFIKERTRIYRESWIISPLEQAIRLIDDVRPNAARLTQLEGERD
jgi:hypothetical protein